MIKEEFHPYLLDFKMDHDVDYYHVTFHLNSDRPGNALHQFHEDMIRIIEDRPAKEDVK